MKINRYWRPSAWLSCYLSVLLMLSFGLAGQAVFAKTIESSQKTGQAKGSNRGELKSKAAIGREGSQKNAKRPASSVAKPASGSKSKLSPKLGKADQSTKSSLMSRRPVASPISGRKLTKAQRLAAIKGTSSAKLVGRHGGRIHRVNQVARVIEPAKPSLGQAIGLHSVEDPLGLRSSVALVADAQTGQVLYEKNGGVVLPIASITKLMTAIVVLDSKANLQASLEVTEDDRDQERNSRSRLPMGTRLTRLELLNLALMASENRAASALSRHHPGGEVAFVFEMNAKAKALGLLDTAFTESTGLSSANVSTARDLAKLVQGAARYPLIRELSTAPELNVDTGSRQLTFRNTNRLVGAESWGVQLQKTGFISEAGQCLVMMARWAERPVIMVFLDSAGRHSRLGDAQRVRDWLDSKSTELRGQEQRGQEQRILDQRQQDQRQQESRSKLHNQSRNFKSIANVEAKG